MRLINAKETAAQLAGISRTSIWTLEKTDARFPRPCLIAGRKAFVAEEIESYVKQIVAERDSTTAGV